jgi:hypothetical protein
MLTCRSVSHSIMRPSHIQMQREAPALSKHTLWDDYKISTVQACEECTARFTPWRLSLTTLTQAGNQLDICHTEELRAAVECV